MHRWPRPPPPLMSKLRHLNGPLYPASGRPRTANPSYYTVVPTHLHYHERSSCMSVAPPSTGRTPRAPRPRSDSNVTAPDPRPRPRAARRRPTGRGRPRQRLWPSHQMRPWSAQHPRRATAREPSAHDADPRARRRTAAAAASSTRQSRAAEPWKECAAGARAVSRCRGAANRRALPPPSAGAGAASTRHWTEA